METQSVWLVLQGDGTIHHRFERLDRATAQAERLAKQFAPASFMVVKLEGVCNCAEVKWEDKSPALSKTLEETLAPF